MEGLDNIPKDTACVFVGNHRSYYDIPLLLAGLDRPHGILAKEELEKIPLLNRWMKLLGCVFVQRDDVRASVRALNDATAIVESGRSFVIFPEGTRYKGEEGGAGEFKQGAFRIAVKTGAPVVPVAITGARALFENNGNRLPPGHGTHQGAAPHPDRRHEPRRAETAARRRPPDHSGGIVRSFHGKLSLRARHRPQGAGPPQRAAVHPERKVGQLVGL